MSGIEVKMIFYSTYLQHNLHQLIKLHPVILLTENVVFDLLSDCLLYTSFEQAEER